MFEFIFPRGGVINEKGGGGHGGAVTKWGR